MPEKRNVDAPWRTRERMLFVRKTYATLPWLDQAFWQGSEPELHHFAHVSTADPSKLAYTPDDRFGAEDRQLRVKPGKYLRKFFPNIADSVIQFWSGKFAAENENPDVHFARTPEEIEQIYRCGPSSCMSGKDYAEDAHPARIYGAGDLAIAYLGSNDGATARCLCWPEKLVFGRIYGDNCRLTAGLDSLGYTQTAGELFDGARMLRIASGDNAFLGPYLDGGIGVNDDGKNLIISTTYAIAADNTSGTIGDTFQCEYCDSATSREDARTVQDQMWCESCCDSYSFWCEDCEEAYPDGDARNVKDSTVCEDCCTRNYTRCDRKSCNEYELDEQIVTVDGEEWCNSCAENDASYCESCEDQVPSDVIVEVRSERGDQPICKSCAEGETFVCEECLSGSDIWTNSDLQRVCNMDLCPECSYDRERAADHCKSLASGWLPPLALAAGRLTVRTRVSAKLASDRLSPLGPMLLEFRLGAKHEVSRYSYALESYRSAPPALPSGPIFLGSGLATCERPDSVQPIADVLCSELGKPNMTACTGYLRIESDGCTRCAVHAHVKTCEFAPIRHCDGGALYAEHGTRAGYRCARHLYLRAA